MSCLLDGGVGRLCRLMHGSTCKPGDSLDRRSRVLARKTIHQAQGKTVEHVRLPDVTIKLKFEYASLASSEGDIRAKH